MGNDRTLTTTENSIRIIELLKERNGARISELDEELDLSPSTIHNHLATLQNQGYVVKQDFVYDLSMKFLQLGRYVEIRDRRYQIIDPKITKLADETGHRANFIIEENGLGVFVFTKRGEHSVETFAQPGRQLFLHASAPGKALLSEFDEERIEEIIQQHGLPRQTGNTITEKDELIEGLTAVQERGFAISDEEYVSGIRALGTPIHNPNGEVIGSIGISGPTNRLTDEKIRTMFSDTLLGVANEIELEIEHNLP